MRALPRYLQGVGVGDGVRGVIFRWAGGRGLQNVENYSTFPPQTVVTFHVLGWGGRGANALFYPSIGRAAVQTLQQGKGHRRAYDWLLSKRGLLHCDVFNDDSNTTYVNIQNIHYTKPDASAYLVQVNWPLRILRKNFDQNMQSSILWLCSC
jgi:hypothetical protein